ncbi:MAG: riboflavin synthase [Planctomycetes bacterium]|nr:riboflavin synthase [Planctomycetota bacterium]
MFTGIIERQARVVGLRGGTEGKRLELEVEAAADLPPWRAVAVGDSVAVSGVCLTAVESQGRRLAFQTVPETLRLTTLGELRPGGWVNLERSLALGDLLGGHLVTGHIDGPGRVLERRQEGDQVLFRIAADPRLLDEILPKGSIAVDGISLTVVEARRREGWFSFAAIPHTLRVTTLGRRQAGEAVNLETDAFGKWILHGLRSILGERSGESWRDLLEQAGIGRDPSTQP